MVQDKDFLSRELKKLAQVMAAILQFRLKNEAESLPELAEISGTALGFDVVELLDRPEKNLGGYLAGERKLSLEEIEIAGYLLREYFYVDTNDERTLAAGKRALILLEYVGEREEVLSFERVAAVTKLRDDLLNQE